MKREIHYPQTGNMSHEGKHCSPLHEGQISLVFSKYCLTKCTLADWSLAHSELVCDRPATYCFGLTQQVSFPHWSSGPRRLPCAALAPTAACRVCVPSPRGSASRPWTRPPPKGRPGSRLLPRARRPGPPSLLRRCLLKDLFASSGKSLRGTWIFTLKVMLGSGVLASTRTP